MRFPSLRRNVVRNTNAASPDRCNEEMEMRDEDEGPSVHTSTTTTSTSPQRVAATASARQGGKCSASRFGRRSRRRRRRQARDRSRSWQTESHAASQQEAKNPRVRLSGKFGRAVTRRRAPCARQEKTDGYGGRLTGVKTASSRVASSIRKDTSRCDTKFDQNSIKLVSWLRDRRARGCRFQL